MTNFKAMTRRDFGRGLAAILATGVAPSVTAGLMQRGLAARQAMAAGGLPYDYESVSYIYGAAYTALNRAYLDTGLKAGQNVSCEIDAAIDGFDHDKGGFVGVSKQLFVQGGAYYIYFENISGTDVNQIIRQTSDSAVAVVNMTNNLPLGHRAKFSLNRGLTMQVVIADDTTEYVRFTQGGTYFQTNDNIGIFRMLNDAYAGSSTPYWYTSYGKLWGAKFWDGEELIGDMRPCYRKSDGIAGVYDVVRKTFISSSGVNEFNFVA